MAEKDGEVMIRVESKAHCIAIRNKLYAHRAALRKRAGTTLGVEASHLDGYKITYREEWDDVAGLTGRWLLTISFDDIVEFELMLPADYDEASLPHFDTALDDHDEDLPPPPAPDYPPDDEMPF